MSAAVTATLERGWYVLGPEVAAFEREFAGYCGAHHAIGVGSGTEALHLALWACGERPGDRVITAPNIAAPTVCAIVEAGAMPAFVDVDPDSFTPDPEALRTYLKDEPGPGPRGPRGSTPPGIPPDRTRTRACAPRAGGPGEAPAAPVIGLRPGWRASAWPKLGGVHYERHRAHSW